MSKNKILNGTGIEEDTFYEVPNFHKVPENMAGEFWEIAKDKPDVLNKGKFCVDAFEENGKINKAYVFFIYNGEVYAKKLNEIEIVLLQRKPSALASMHNMMRRSITGETVQ